MTNAAANLTRRFRAAELDLLSVLEVVVARAPKVLKSGLPNLAFFRAANEALAEPDTEEAGGGFTQVEFWVHLARGLELITTAEGNLTVTPAADEFFELPIDARRERLQEAWLSARDINEFEMCPELELPSLKKGRTVDVTTDVPEQADIIHGRHELVRMVREITAETPLRQFIRDVHNRAPNTFINHDDDGSWRKVHYRGIREAGGREDIERDGNWTVVEGAVIRFMIDHAVSRLGWIEYDPRTEMLNPVPDTAEPAPEFEVVVQPNFEIMILGDRLDPSSLWRLARFTTPAHEARVRKYVLERKPFADALGRGADAEELTAYLAGLSRTPLPQNVRFSLRDWATLSERIKVWPDALLIEAEGVEELEKSLSEQLRQAFGAARVTGGHYACPAPGAAAMREHVPARRKVFDYTRRLPPVIEPGEDTTLRARREELHLRARQLLDLVSRSEATDRYELHPERVVQSARALGAEELLRRIREGMSKPMSAPLAMALRTWSGEFSRPYAGGAEVLLAENLDQAGLIEELPQVKRWIERRLSPGVYLLRPGGTKNVHDELEKLGIELRDSPRET